MNFTYYMPTRILFGAGQLNRLHEQKLPGRKALIVVSAGKSVRANGYLARVVVGTRRERVHHQPVLLGLVRGMVARGMAQAARRHSDRRLHRRP